MAPKTAQEAPKTAQEAPKTAQEAPKTAQEAPRTAQEAPKTAQELQNGPPGWKPAFFLGFLGVGGRKPAFYEGSGPWSGGAFTLKCRLTESGLRPIEVAW